MIEETYDQSRLDIVPAPKHVSDEHILFERLVVEVAAKQEADRVVVSPMGLTILVSGDGLFDSKSMTIGDLPVEIDPQLMPDAPAILYKDGVEVGKVNVAADTIRFI